MEFFSSAFIGNTNRIYRKFNLEKLQRISYRFYRIVPININSVAVGSGGGDGDGKGRRAGNGVDRSAH